MTSNLSDIAVTVRDRMARLLKEGKPLRETALLLADIEEEGERHERVVADLAGRASTLGTSSGGSSEAAFMDRPHPPDVDPRASKPWKAGLKLTESSIARGVVFTYETANPTFYRAVIDRLKPGEKVRNVTRNHRTYEYTRDEFLTKLADIARSESYRIGPPSDRGSCRYTTGNPSPALISLEAPNS